jgi:carbonic anhydrase
MHPVPASDDLVANAARYAEAFEPNGLTASPVRHVCVVACMDARLDLFALLGLEIGDAHLIRNAGGIATDDVLRSLALSQRLLGTEEVVIVQHTGCGLLDLDDEAFLAEVEAQTGQRPGFEPGGFHDIDDRVRRSLERLRTDPVLPHRDRIRGFVYDVETGRLREVS